MAGCMGKTDRQSRIAAGVVLVGFAMATGNPLGWVGALCIATGILAWCPLYAPLGIDTCQESGTEHH